MWLIERKTRLDFLQNTEDQQPRTKEAANMNDDTERSAASAGSGAKPATCGGLRLTREEVVALTFIAHNNPKDGFVRRTWLEFKTAICGLLQRTRVNGWISVSDGLPQPPASEWEDSVSVLAWSKSNGRGIAHYIFDDDYGNRWQWECVGEPTHWMPLPAPPTDGK